MTVKEPSRATLRKYGLSLDRWRLMLARQGYVCALCGKVPESGRLVIDHFHARGYSKMKPEQKRQHVRGLLCSMPCNRYYVAKLSLPTAAAVLSYLEKHRDRTEATR